jgi:hypothetical protein
MPTPRLNAMADAGLKPADIDGIASADETPVTVAHYLGLTRIGRRHRSRRLLIYDPRPPPRRGDRVGSLQDDHAWRERKSHKRHYTKSREVFVKA